MNFATVVTSAAALALTCLPLRAESPADRDQRMQWWREARFGMFVHWGLYSGLAGSWQDKMVSDTGGLEWIQQRVGADTYSYAAQAVPKFQPKKDFAREWAALAREAGCQYVVFTTKHHDGFALHDSKHTQYDAGDLLNRDLVREICEALRAEGLKVGFYHSVIDWHHPQYDFTRSKQLPYPVGGRKLAVTPRNHGRYIDFLHGQVDELVSNYGPVDVLWWDYSSQDFQGQDAWRAFDLMAAVRAKQPAVIMNNRLFRLPEAGFGGMGTGNITARMDHRYGDFITPEQHIPATGMPGVDWETCMTMNTTWGYNQHDLKWKPSRELIRNLIDIASKGGNYLLNIGPTGDGSVPPASVASMQDIGAWMKVNAESIRGTTASPLAKTPFDGRLTTKGAVHYAHVFSRPESGVIALPFKVSKASLLAGGGALAVRAAGDGAEITLPPALPDPVATVIRLE
ncbi:MAG: alpha-L-fucosidase [Akkermansiaceae bacterium]|jgi:alpha-L-fucosidase|nr:alpha-L-fucosidase [Akkermansiaceae bacterium]